MHARMLMFAARGEIRRTVRSTLTVPASGGIVQLRCSFARHTMINDNVNVATLWPHPQSRLSRRGSSTCTTRELSAGLLSAQMRDVHLYRAARSSDETRILNTQALPLRVWRLWRCQRRVIWFSDFPLPISPLCRAGPFRPIGLIGDLPDSSLTCVSRRRMDSRPYVMASPTAISWPSARPHPPLSRSRSHPNPRRL